MTESDPDIELHPDRARELLAEGAQLVDIRQQHEWEAGRIPGAHWIDLTELTGRADEIDGERAVVFYCRSGERSRLAADAFRSSGLRAYNLSGGIIAWSEAGLGLEPDGARIEESTQLGS